MTMLRILRQACFGVFQQLKQQPKFAFTPTLRPNRTGLNNDRPSTLNFKVKRTLLLLKIQSPNSLDHRRYISKTASPDHAVEAETKSLPVFKVDKIFGTPSNLNLFSKFKFLSKKYWHVFIPVHMVTSSGWFVGFYYLSKSGMDMSSLLDQIHALDLLNENLKNSSMSHISMAWLYFNLATPLRYMLTVGGTIEAIKYLIQAGYIQPDPIKQELMNTDETKNTNTAGK